MSDFVIVSFCNLSTPTNSPLLCLHIPEKSEEIISCAPVSLGYPELISSATGLSRYFGKIYVLFTSFQKKVFVAILNEEDLSPLYYQELPEVKDGHSVLAFERYLYVVSTGTDEVVRYEIKEHALENPVIFWQASNTKTDTHHINSIVEYEGDVLVSAFGKKSGKLWATASNGYVYNVSKHLLISDGHYHPHSLSVRNGKIYYSDSHNNSFCVVGQSDSVFNLNSYTRGIAWISDDLTCITTSIGRRVSKSSGLVTNPADPGDIAGNCSLFLGNVSESKIINKVDLSWFGAETYDVLALPYLRIDLLKLANLSYLAERDSLQIFLNQNIVLNHQVDIIDSRNELINKQVAPGQHENPQMQNKSNSKYSVGLSRMITRWFNKEKTQL